MQSKLFSLVVFIITPFISFSQGYYENRFDFGHYDHPEAVITDEAGNIIVCGWFEDANFENQRAFVLKVDTDGQEIWRYVFEETTKFHNLCIMESDEIALAGSNLDHCYLTVLSAETGNQVWSYEENASNGYWFGSINELYNGVEYRLYAVKTTVGTHTPIVYAIASSSGQLLEQFLYHRDLYHAIEFSFQETPELFWFGEKNVVVATNYEGVFLVYWTYFAIHTAGMDRISPNKACIVRFNYWAPDYYMVLMTMNLSTGYVYNNFIDLDYEDVEVLGSGVLGYEKILATGTIEGDLSLWLFDNDLNLINEITYPHTNPRTGIDVVGLLTNDMVIMGYESIDNGSASDVFLMKRDANGLVSTNELTDETDVRIFPNPATDRIFIKNTGNLDVEVDIINSLGQIVKRVTNINQYLSIEDLPKGCYVATIKVDGAFVGQKKLIKQ